MSASSYWQGATPRSSFGHGPLPSVADVVVIGGGLLGVCCAYWLSCRGRSVLLLERSGIAAGATGRSPGFLTPTHPLAAEGLDVLRRIVEEEGINSDFRMRDSIRLALDDDEAGQLSRRELEELIRTPLADRVVGGVAVPGALTNPVALADGITAAARHLGATVHTGIRVKSVRSTPQGVSVETSDGPVRAAAAVVAVNAWLGDLVPSLEGVIKPVQGQAIATPPMPAMFPCGFVAPTPAGDVSWQQTPDGRIILSGCRDAAPPPDDPAAQMPQPEVHRALLDVLPTLLPAIGPIRAVRAWAGVMAVTADRLPIVDEVEEKVWAVGGFDGHGMPSAAIVADLVAEWICSGDRPAALNPLAAGLRWSSDRHPGGATA